MLVIDEKQISGFIEKLKESFEVFSVQGGDKLPFKKYFFPPEQKIFSSEKTKINEAKAPKKFVLFGLNLPQLEALTQLDEIMTKGEDDFFYSQNRAQSFIIGLIDEEIDAMPGGDIIFQKIGDGKYKVWAENEKAKKIIKKYKEFFIEDYSKDSPLGDFQVESLEAKGDFQVESLEVKTELSSWSQSMRKLLLDPELLANAVEWSRGNKIWEELAEKCLGCGICTYVCPICHCFSIEDRIGLDNKCSRLRKWDSCVLPSFSSIAGGHSFRPSLKERYYNWFYHKFVMAYKKYGKSQCVGCGACKKNCPAEIDIQEILIKILQEYNAK